jgi:hypothetical protein
MIMKRLIKTVLACGVSAACVIAANAAPTMRLSADGGATWLTIPDNSALDADTSDGSIIYFGPVGPWIVNIASAIGSPAVGGATDPVMDVGTTTTSPGAQTLIVQMSDTNYVGFPNETFIARIGVNTGGTVTYNSYIDSGNVLFGSQSTYSGDAPGVSPSPTAALLLAEGPFVNTTVVYSNAVVVPNPGAKHSLTLETTITETAAGKKSTVDSVLFNLPPPPCNCTLIFNSPANLTNCADDVITNVTASQDCGAGYVDVPVTLVSAATNGVCPQVITRSYTATDNCGTVHPFTQTITVNCKPDCTITPSVTTANVGTTNNATVADAGPGATYLWNVINGIIISGQNSTTLTWKAGSDTNSPISILVTVTAATGCQSSCSASVKLVCPPPPPGNFGSGDTATIGFWQNKNGQGLILGASNAPALANWLAGTFPCLYGTSSSSNLTGKANSVIADRFVTLFKGSTPKTDAQVMCLALGCYFTSTSLGGGTGPVKFGFNQTPGGTGVKMFNVGSYGTSLGLQNNTSYTILQILQAANNVRCGNQNAVLPNDLFDAINTGGDIK